MSIAKTPRSDNKLRKSKHYGAILAEYNKRYAEKGKVVARDFFNEVITPIEPTFKLSTWYSFLKNFKDQAGLTHLAIVEENKNAVGGAEEGTLSLDLLDNQTATARGINTALNMGAQYLAVLHKKFIEDPSSLSVQENRILADSMHKAMKSQDSRINAIGKIREDNRQEEQMQHAFDNAQYE